MNYGFTTGSCAAAAAKAGAYMLLGGNRKDRIRIDTPAGIEYEAEIENIDIGEQYVSCAVRKYSGDDPDITNGILIYARVEYAHPDSCTCTPETEESGDISDGNNIQRVIIEGGEGIGIVTRPGLDQPVGNAAINSVPRSMITDEVRQVMDLFDHQEPLKVTISVPGGEELALQTFNPRLGIEGGISIIGTTGIVEPMSTRAILETIRLELNQRRIAGHVKSLDGHAKNTAGPSDCPEGNEAVVISPGNYGLAFMKEHYGYDLNDAVKCSNYIGETLDMAVEAGFKRLLLAGHIGKLIKVSGGIMNTHSREADCRMELMAAAAVRAHADHDTLNGILNSVSTEEAYGFLVNAGIEKECMSHIMDKVMYHLNKRTGGRLDISCIIYSNKWGLLGCSAGDEELSCFFNS